MSQSQIPGDVTLDNVQIPPHDIPHDVALDILPNLPVKTLVRFMCVSKLWHTVISDPEFAKLHYKLVCRDTKRVTRKILVSTPSCVKFLEFGAAECFGDECRFVKLGFPSKRPRSVVKIVGSCRGLVCVALDECRNFFVWNPATGDCRRLPDPGIVPCGDFYSHGFGYDVSSDDFKVFVAGQVEGSSEVVEIGVFSLKRSCWRKFQNPFGIINHIIHSDDPLGLFLNGILHWKAKWSESRGEFEVIFAFSLAEENVWEIALPDRGVDVYGNTLGVLGRCLSLTCLVCEDNVRDVIEFWAMKDHGVNQSWVKLIRISTSLIDYNYSLRPLCITRDKGISIILINDGKELISYCVRDRKLEHLKIWAGQNECEATAYVESLLSPNVDNGTSGNTGERSTM